MKYWLIKKFSGIDMFEYKPKCHGNFASEYFFDYSNHASILGKKGRKGKEKFNLPDAPFD